MKNKIIKLAPFSAMAIAMLIGTFVANASVVPTLSLSSLGDGNNVKIVVYGDPNANINFTFTNNNNTQQTITLGSTDPYGNFNSTISTSGYAISQNSIVFVTINGMVSSQTNWPVLTGSNPLSLNQTSLNLNLGQSTVVTGSAYTGSTYSVSYNSNPSIASVSISSNQITVIGLANGTTNINICSTSNSSICSILSVTVNGTTNNQLTFSQNNINLIAGQNQYVTVTGGSGLYVINSNSNPAYVTATISGNTVTLSTNSTSGNSAIRVCTTDNIYCGIINVNINNTNTYNYNSNYQSPYLRADLQMQVGQSVTIGSSNATGALSVTGNLSPNVASASISGNSVIINAITYGSDTITVCQNGSTTSCGIYNLSIKNPTPPVNQYHPTRKIFKKKTIRRRI